MVERKMVAYLVVAFLWGIAFEFFGSAFVQAMFPDAPYAFTQTWQGIVSTGPILAVLTNIVYPAKREEPARGEPEEEVFLDSQHDVTFSPVPQDPQSVTVRWERTQILEARVPLSNVRVLTSKDSPIRVGEGGEDDRDDDDFIQVTE